MSEFEASFNVFNKSQRQTGKETKLRDRRVCKVSIIGYDFQGISPATAFHKRGVLLLDSFGHHFSAVFTSTSAL